MNYFYTKLHPLFVIIVILGCMVSLFGFWWMLIYQLDKRYKLSDTQFKWIISIAGITGFATLFWAVHFIPDYFTDGEIRYIYLATKKNKTRVVVWFTRVDHPAGIGTEYSHRLKSYDLKSGKQHRRQDLAVRYYLNDYTIFGPFNNNAWGYSGQVGLSFLDFFETRIVYDEEDILRNNPRLGDKIRLISGYKVKRFDPVTFGMYVYAGDGGKYHIDLNMKATSTSKLGKQKQHDKATCAVCQHEALFKDNIYGAKRGWSADTGNTHILAFFDSTGKDVNYINIHKRFGEKAYLLTTATINSETLLFVTKKRCTLQAIRTDAGTGEILGYVDYF